MLKSSFNTEGIQENINPYCRYYASSTPAYASGVFTIVNFDTKVHDPLNCVTTGAAWKFTAPKGGLYLVTASSLLDSAAVIAGQEVSLSLYWNGGLVSRLGGSFSPAAGTSYMPAIGSHAIPLVKGDYIDVRLVQNSGGNRNVTGTGTFNYITISRIGRAA